jgi:DMSO/TMAO reductase YedYZ molybdopterin-dependent catalytic subunit
MVTDRTDLYREFGDSRLPPGQRETDGFPVLSMGGTPAVDPAEWTLETFGAVAEPTTWDPESFRALGVETQRQDFHCVTGWSKFDCEFTGVPFPHIAEAVGVEERATHVMFHSHDGYTTDLPLADCLREAVLVAFGYDGDPLPADHGGPLRVVTPHKYAYKGAKWLSGIEFLRSAEPGYWEQRGYSSSANPWAEERYG